MVWRWVQALVDQGRFEVYRKYGKFHPRDPDQYAHGKTRFATRQNILDAGHAITDTPNFYPWFGFNLHETKEDSGVNVGLKEPGHILVTAPTRAGKGTTQIIPNLLTYRGSVVVNDIKGENFAITAARRSHYGRVYVLDPFGITKHKSDSYNPFDFIRGGDFAWDDAKVLAEALVVPAGERHEANFWELGGRDLLATLVLYVRQQLPQRERHIETLRSLYASGLTKLRDTLIDIEDAGHPNSANAARRFLDYEEKVQNDISATLTVHSNVWESPQLARVMRKSDFKFGTLKSKPTTVYVVVPPEYLESHAAYIKLIFSQAVAAMMRNQSKPEHEVWFMLDEFLALGRMSPIEEGLRYLAGYGVKLWLFIQDLPKMRQVYGADGMGTFMANCQARMFFGTQDHETAQLISDMLGEETIITRAYKDGEVTPQLAGRAAATPSTIRELPKDRAFLWLSNLPPIGLQLTPYFENDYFKDVYEPWQ